MAPESNNVEKKKAKFAKCRPAHKRPSNHATLHMLAKANHATSLIINNLALV